MPDTNLEVLVIMGSLAQTGVSELVSPHGKVVQAVSSRVAVVAASAEVIESIGARPDVERVLAGTESPPPGMPSLNDAERLFVAAWTSRQVGETKTRKGDGLDWDATGFDAP